MTDSLKMDRDDEDGAESPTDARRAAVTAEWTLAGDFVHASATGLDELKLPIPLCDLLDEFSRAALARRERLARMVEWPTRSGPTVPLDATFSIIFDRRAAPAGIVLSAFAGPFAATDGDRRDAALSAFQSQVVDMAASLPERRVSDTSGVEETDEAALQLEDIAAAMITLAGSLRDLSDSLALSALTTNDGDPKDRQDED